MEMKNKELKEKAETRLELKRHFRYRLIILAVVMLLLGIFLLVIPGNSMKVLGIFAGVLAFVYALAKIVSYFLVDDHEKTYNTQFGLAALAITLGVFLIKDSNLIWDLLGVFCGAIFMFQAGYQIQLSLLEHKYKFKLWWVGLILALVFIAFGVYSLIVPGGVNEVFVLVEGILFIVAAIANIVSLFSLYFNDFKFRA